MRCRLLAVGLCVIFTLALFAGCGGGGGGGGGGGQPASGPQVIGGGQTTITGQVVDATNVTSPIPDAYVYVPLSPPTQPSSHRALPSQVIAYDTTDQQGNYRLQNVPGGTLTMVVEPPETSNFNGVQLDITAPDAGEIYIRVTLLPRSVFVTAVLVDPASASLVTGDTQQFTATVLGASGQQIETAVVWTVTGGIGSVDENGLFTASAPGSGMVVALAGDKAGTATVEVSPRTGAISGTVTNAETGAGIPGATVTADGETTTTDAYGAYTISGLVAGDYTVTASANGYAQGSVQVTLAEGEGASANISLQPTGATTGKVTDASTGDPIEGATVSTGGKSATTDSSGNYTISGLSPGDYTVTASKGGYGEASTTVTVEPGKTVTADFELQPQIGSITGRVIDAATGDPIEGATVSVAGTSTTTDSNGIYIIFNLPAGDYTVTAWANFHAEGSVQVTVVGGQRVSVDDIELGRGEYYEKWHFQSEKGRITTPAIGSDGAIYAMDNYILYTLNPDGSEKWRFHTGGLSSSPAIASDGTIYGGSDHYAINPDGSEKWRLEGVDVLSSSPAIGSDGTIYVGSDDHNLYAINPDGSEKWRFATGDWRWSSAAIGSDGTIYVRSGDGNLYAVNPDGSQKWQFWTGGDVEGNPAIGSDGTIYVVVNSTLYAINPDGSENWRRPFPTWPQYPWSSSPAIGSNGTIYVGYGDYLYALNPDGSKKWRFEGAGVDSSSPAIGSDGTIYVGSYAGNLYAINPDGSEKWRFETSESIGSPTIGPDGTIYVGSGDGTLYAFGVYDETPQLDTSAPWPMLYHDIRHTGRYGYVPSVGRFFRPW